MDVRIRRIDREAPLDILLALPQRGFAVVPPSEARVRSLKESERGVERCRVRVERQSLLPAFARGRETILGDRAPEVRKPLHPPVPRLDVIGGRVPEPRLLARGQAYLHFGRK